MDAYEFSLFVSVVVGVLIGLHAIWLMKSSIFKGFVYPVVFTLCVFIGSTSINSLRGYPVPEYPKGKVEVTAHEIQGEWIVAWFKHSNGDSRLYRIPATDENKKAMEGSDEAAEKGQRATVHWGTDHTPSVQLVDLSELYPKGE